MLSRKDNTRIETSESRGWAVLKTCGLVIDRAHDDHDTFVPSIVASTCSILVLSFKFWLDILLSWPYSPCCTVTPSLLSLLFLPRMSDSPPPYSPRQ